MNRSDELRQATAGGGGAGMMLPVSQLLIAVLLNLAINDWYGQYSPFAIGCVASACVVGLMGLVWRRRWFGLVSSGRYLLVLLAGCLLLGVVLQLRNFGGDYWFAFLPPLIALAAGLALLKRPLLRGMSLPLVLVCFALLAMRAVAMHGKDNAIDVLNFQRESAAGLLQGRNPYAMRYANIYPRETGFYGPGVVDEHNRLTYGFPYFPLSLLLVLPGHWAGDVRYAHAVALLLSGLLLWLARPRPAGVMLAAAQFLSPVIYVVIGLAWTEPLLILMLSLVMYCSLRWRRRLPIALGLFFATKQYTVLAVPAVWLLARGPRPGREYCKLLGGALAVAAAITLPFFLWNPHEFWRAVVQWQFVQPFRDDALSLLVWYARGHGGKHLPLWTPFVAVVPITALALWRLPRHPAGFAAALTMIYLTFFAMNKQAFCNYYFFVIATACWCVAAWDAPPAEDLRPEHSHAPVTASVNP